MSTQRQFRREQNGSALVAVLTVILVVTAVLGTVAGMSANRAFMARKLSERIKAVAIAEAGASHAYSMLATNFDLRLNDSAFPPTPYHDGYYDVTVKPVGANVAVIYSTGVCGSVSEYVMLDIQRFPQGSAWWENPAATSAFAYAAVSGGSMTWNGSGTIRVEGGRLHSNSEFNMTGSGIMTGRNSRLSSSVGIRSTGSTIFYGDAAAPAYEGKSPENILGTVTTGAVPVVGIPNIDLTPYYNWALTNGQVFTPSGGTLHLTGSSDYVVPGGILWVNGNLKISMSGRCIGCFIATGNIDWSGSGDQIQVNRYPALVSRDGSISISGSGRFTGLIYARNGNFDKTGSGDVVGSIICGGTFDRGGSWNYLAYSNATPVAPGQPMEAQDIVAVNAWQR